jgi:Ser/Thr protein kinase RdoA (MazF antagonist)
MDQKSVDIFEANRDAILSEAAKRFGVDVGSLNRLGSFESLVYEFTQGDKDRILKITHSLHRTPDQVRGELDWTNYLADHEVSVSLTIPSVNREQLEVIDGKSVTALGDDYFMVYAVEKAAGEFTQPDDWNDRLIQEWGRVIGRMHALAKTYTPKDPAWKRFEWYEDKSLRVEDHVPVSQPVVIERCHDLIKRMRSWPVDNDSYGLIHSDLHHSNFVANNGRITAFDFDDCHYSWFGFDIMIPLFYALRDHRIDPDDAEFARRFLGHFLEGYRRENSIGGEWIKRIPDYMKLRELDLYSIIFAEDAAEENGWCRRFMENRQHRIENEIPVIDLDFSEFV